MFSKQLMCVCPASLVIAHSVAQMKLFILTKPSQTTSDYTMDSFKENRIDIATKTMVKEVKEKVVVAQNEKKELVEYPYGLLVW